MKWRALIFSSSPRGCVAATVLAALLPAAVPHANDAGRARRLIAERLPRIEYRGGPFLRTPTIVTVTFGGDDPRRVARLERFGEQIARSDWWRSVTEGYCASPGDCIGTGTAAPPVRLTKTLPARIRDVDVEALLEAEARDGALSRLEKDSLIVAYLPAGVVLSDAFSPRYCDGGPRAFHRTLRGVRMPIPFAVVPRCGDEAETTMSASHEILEAATNADPSRPGFRFPPGPAAIAFTALGSEPVDPCNLVNRVRPRAETDGFFVQRAWSNRLAAAGTDPCTPAVPGRPYVALVPERPVARLSSVGATAEVLVRAVADRPTGPWSISAIDLADEREGSPYVAASLDRKTVRSGDTATLTLELLRASPRRDIALVALTSRVDGHEHVWPLAVSMR